MVEEKPDKDCATDNGAQQPETPPNAATEPKSTNNHTADVPVKESDKKNDKHKKDEKAEKKEKEKEKDKEKDKKAEPPPKPKSEFDILKEQKGAVEKECADWKEKYAFLQAELENTRKHFIKQQDVVRNRAKIDVITQFMPLLDSLDFAIQNSKKLDESKMDTQFKNFLKGFENLKQSILNIFQNLSVKPIDALNKLFDYKVHEAVMTLERTDVPDETIVQIVQTGYTLNNDVIRPAKVIVAKHPAPPPPPEPVPEANLTATAEMIPNAETPQKAEAGCAEASEPAKKE
jgi:molecular chaperone GrpE